MFGGSGLIMIISAVAVLLLGGGAVAYSFVESRKAKKQSLARLRVSDPDDEQEEEAAVSSENHENDLAEIAAKKAAEFYASTDAENVVRLRQKLMRAGFLNPDAVGRYFLARFIGLGIGIIGGLIASVFMGYGIFTTQGVTITGGALLVGYMA
ncbi:MAG: hypothetical protein AAFR27_07070, partial [Pseudomonadota bacterium]